MCMDKTLRRVTDPEEQQAETYCYWASRPIGERLTAVCELTESAYAFAAGFKRRTDEPYEGPEGHPFGV
jgi:hypothetical protein